jgi:hypothetical protein
MKARIVNVLIASGFCMILLSTPLFGCRVEVINDTKINLIIKDQEAGYLFTVHAGSSQEVGEMHRRPTIVIYMQVDRYQNAPYKKEFTVKQIACSGAMSGPVPLPISSVISGNLDPKIFERNESANTHKKLKAGLSFYQRGGH